MKEQENKQTAPAGATQQKYVAPALEIIEVETAQNILGGSTAPLPGLPGEDW